MLVEGIGAKCLPEVHARNDNDSPLHRAFACLVKPFSNEDNDIMKRVRHISLPNFFRPSVPLALTFLPEYAVSF